MTHTPSGLRRASSAPEDTSTTRTPRSPLRHRLTALAGGLAIAVAVPLAAPAAAQAATVPAVTAKAATGKAASSTSITLSKHKDVKGGKRVRVKVVVHVHGKRVRSGKVFVNATHHKLRAVAIRDGIARTTLPGSLPVGRYNVKALYRGTSTVASSQRKAKLVIVSGTPKVVRIAKSLAGTPYRTGGTTPRGFDCSGFTRYVYKKAGVKTLSHSSSAQRHAGKVVSRKHAKPGDLIWTPGHVAIYVGKGKQIDAPRPGKSIKVRSIWQSNPTFIRVSSKAVSV
ncbi:C40 family peptidase [Cellulomonas massiliensis]|uniref:C40 family peptidase n=1 Tax=Cellulomonas massiliensis TaxID=1465811 RepID=UPI000304E913|nr:C40 family peptidase [Cellulomonas massiliensis]